MIFRRGRRRGGASRPKVSLVKMSLVEDGTEPPEAAEPPEGEGRGLRPPDDAPHGDMAATRKKQSLWDRVRYVILLTLLWFVLVWAAMADNPLLPFSDAMRQQSTAASWVFVLLGLELVRQAHFFVSERWARYHRFWTHRVFGGFERFTHRRFKPWTRFRVWRAVIWAFWIAVFALVASKILDTSPVLALFEAPALLWKALPFLLQIVFLFFVIIIQFVGLFWFLSRGGIDTYMPDDITTRFSDVWGQDHVVDRVKENIVFLEKPQEIEAKGGYVPGGILLWGPPGTGKTLMAEAVAGETGHPYVFVDPGAFVQMFMGIGVLKVKSLFRKLRKLALRYGGVIVFFDEADSLGRRGSLAQVGPGGGRPAGIGALPSGTTVVAPSGTSGASSSGRPGALPFDRTDGAAICHGMSYLSSDTRWQLAQDRFFMGGGMNGGGGDMGTLQALLTELSGLKKPRGFVNRYVRRLLGMKPKPPPKYRILVMMATNMPEALDEALLRPGRIDRIYKVGYPSKAGRVRTYEGYFSKVRHDLTGEELDKLATITPYATGASIKDLVNEALITAIRDGREVITWGDVMKAKQLKSLGPPEGVEYHDRERHATAVHEACHAVVAIRARRHLEIDIATIEKGAEYLGMVASIPVEDQFTQWRSEYQADILVSLASLAGERMFFGGDSSSGVSGDLESATRVASLMEGYWGMGSTISSHAISNQLGMGTPGAGGKGAKEAEKEMRRALADRIEDQLTALLKQVERMLEEDRAAVLAVAHALETHKTLQGEDVLAVIDGREGPLVDGRIYADPAFRRELEAYHQAALAAHGGRTPVQLTLPASPEPPVRDSARTSS
ncbi:AAA family ATPase [Spirillospora sp. NPDC048911]|uniref:AAA family ATPase n=1 Tax=Spirillospora sp. NPDC048911 TaxID=3364527 RepID=UPI003721797F